MATIRSFYKNKGPAAVVVSVFAAVLLIVTMVEAATTVSTNISTDGTLSVTGASTLTGGVVSGSTITVPAGYGLDTAANGELNIGTTSATTINIGRSGQTATVLGNLSVTGNALFPGGVTVGSAGTEIEDHFSATAVLNFPAIAANDCEELTMTVTGVDNNNFDAVALGIQDSLVSASSTLTFTGWVSANDTVTVRACQIASQGTSDLPLATIRASVWQYEPGDDI